MRELLVKAQISYLTGVINKHIANVEVLLNRATGIGEPEHQDIQNVIEIELGRIADYHDKLEMLQKFFVKPAEPEKETKKNAK